MGMPRARARGSGLEICRQRFPSLLCCQGSKASKLSPSTAEKCLTLAVMRVALCSMAAAPISASGRRLPCDSAGRSINSASRLQPLYRLTSSDDGNTLVAAQWQQIAPVAGGDKVGGAGQHMIVIGVGKHDARHGDR